MTFDQYGFVENMSRKLQEWLKRGESNGYFTWRRVQLW
jgi:hypothetical protein